MTGPDPDLLRVAVITGDPSLDDPTKHEDRFQEEDERAHRAMEGALRSLDGYDFRFIREHAGLLDRLRDDPPDLVLNFCDTGFRNEPTRELNLPAYLELLDVPCTGSPPAALAICYDKAIVRLVAEASGVPVPRETLVPADRALDDLPALLPALVKPNAADGSVGITRDAVVRTREEMRAYLSRLREALPGRDALVQEFLPGAEYGVGLLGNPETGLTALPALEVDYSRLPAGLAPILSYESKAIPDSPYWTEIGYRRAALPAETEARMDGWAKTLFRRLGLRDYGRFDYRVGADGEPKLMEVNPNPAWADDGKLALMAGFAGLAYRDLLGGILDAAKARIDATGRRGLKPSTGGS